MKAKFTVLKGEDRGIDFLVGDGQTVSIGRSSERELTLYDQGISRKHCQLENQGDTVILTDLGSTNGTWVNQKRVQRAELHEQDHVKVGRTAIIFRGLVSASGEPAAPEDTPSAEAKGPLEMRVASDESRQDPDEGVVGATTAEEGESDALSVAFSLDDSVADVETVRDSPEVSEPAPEEAPESDYDLAPASLPDLGDPTAPADEAPHESGAQGGAGETKGVPQPGLTIAGCQLTDRIECNDVCFVLRGEQGAIGRPVLVYLLRDEIAADMLERERFTGGCRAAARVDNVSLARVFDVGEEDGWCYMIAECVEGISTAHLMEEWGRTGKFDTAKAAEVARSIALALHSGHRSGLVHLGVCPKSVIVTAKGAAKLTGLSYVRAVQRGQPDNVTRTEGAPDFIQYRSPEEVTELAPIDHRADIYALGATLFALATGQAPFESARRGTLIQDIRDGESAPPAQLNPELSPGLCTIITKAMAREPGERYDSAAEMAADLQLALKRL